jgi:hypothetical protein
MTVLSSTGRLRALALGLGLSCGSCSALQPSDPPSASSSPQASAVHARVAQPLVHDQSTASAPGAAKAAAPVALTTADGTGLRLVSYRARGAIRGPLALTELHFTFRNPRAETIEGRFEITLPPEASISRFALKLPHGWQEAEVVKRQAARRVYEDFLHRKQDPALLERSAGNRFRARVFPIAAKANKEIVIAYSQELANTERPYRLPLRGLPTIGELDIHVTDRQRSYELRRKNHRPEVDFSVALRRGASGLRHDNLVVARLEVEIEAETEPIDDLLVLVDTSASRALDLEAQLDRLAAVLRQLGGLEKRDPTLQVACFDQEIATVFEGPVSQWRPGHLELIARRAALGASNIERALRWAAKSAPSRILLLSDGVATAGATDRGALRKLVRDLAPHTKRIDVLVHGAYRDKRLLRALVRGNLARDGIVIGQDASPRRAAERLRERTVSNLRVSVAGARWVWPRQLDGVQSGDEVLIYADLAQQKPDETGQLTVALRGAVQQLERIELKEAPGPLLRRSWASARIERLTQLLQDEAAVDPQLEQLLKARIVELSREQRVLTDVTALLVLETEADYRRYGIDRRSLTDILSVTARGPKVIRRSKAVLRRAKAHRLHALSAGSTIGADDATALDGLIEGPVGEGSRGSAPGIVGLRFGRASRSIGAGPQRMGVIRMLPKQRVLSAGRGGAGVAYGTGAGRVGRQRKSPSVVTLGSGTVRGSLSRDIIRRIVRRHINELRFCAVEQRQIE